MAARDAYDILGLPRESLTSAIRSRYRQLARRHSKDIATAQLFRDVSFLEITRAYLLLTSHQRREYDRELRAAHGKAVPLSDLLAAQAPAEGALLQGQISFWRGLYREAALSAQTLLETHRNDSRGWALLGDILLVERKYDEAIAMYNYAVQFEPSNQRYWQLLNEATARKEGREHPHAATEQKSLARPARVWFVLGGALLIVELTLLMMWIYPGRIWEFGLARNDLIYAAANGFVLALALASTDWLGSFDDELISYSVPFAGMQMVPLGLYLIPIGALFFWVGALFYAATCYLDDRASGSVVAAFVCTAALTGIMVAFVGAGWQAFLILGADAVFVGFMVGWMLGSLRIFPWRPTKIEHVEESL